MRDGNGHRLRLSGKPTRCQFVIPAKAGIHINREDGFLPFAYAWTSSSPSSSSRRLVNGRGWRMDSRHNISLRRWVREWLGESSGNTAGFPLKTCGNDTSIGSWEWRISMRWEWYFLVGVERLQDYNLILNLGEMIVKSKWFDRISPTIWLWPYLLNARRSDF